MHSRVIFWIKIRKNRSTFGADIPYSEKTVLLLQNSKTQSAHQFQSSGLDFALYRLIFFGYSKFIYLFIYFFWRGWEHFKRYIFHEILWRILENEFSNNQ